MRILRVLAFSALAAAMLSGFSGAPAQVSVNIGVAPVCPYGYFDFAPYDCAPYGYYGPDWFVGVCLSGPAHGFTVRAGSMAMSTTATILVTATADRFLPTGNRRSAISTLTRRRTGMATSAIPAMTEAANIPPDFKGEAMAEAPADMAAAVVIAREREKLETGPV